MKRLEQPLNLLRTCPVWQESLPLKWEEIQPRRGKFEHKEIGQHSEVRWSRNKEGFCLRCWTATQRNWIFFLHPSSFSSGNSLNLCMSVPQLNNKAVILKKHFFWYLRAFIWFWWWFVVVVVVFSLESFFRTEGGNDTVYSYKSRVQVGNIALQKRIGDKRLRVEISYPGSTPSITTLNAHIKRA